MTTTNRSRKTPTTTAPDDPRVELDRAASDLEALADAHDECTNDLETFESMVDAMLDDPSVHVLILDEERKVTGVSRGMAAQLGDRQALGRRVTSLVPPTWTGLDAALDTLTAADGWREVPLDQEVARLCVRRATDDHHPAVYLVRYDPREG
jgi:hypothetical protein